MSSLISEHKLNLEIILSEEITQYKQWEKKSKDVLVPLFMEAAKKLEKSGIPSENICGLLTKQWPREGWRLRANLPPQYKQLSKDTSKSQDEQPQDQMDEFLKLISDTLEDASDVFKSLYKRHHESEGINRKDFQHQLKEIFEGDGSPPLHAQLTDWKKWNIELSQAKQESDERTKLSTFYKVMVRIQALHGTKSDVAKKARLSHKWYKNGIEMDPTIQANFNKMIKWLFPDNTALASQMADWFAKCLLLDEQDPDAKKPLPPTREGYQEPDDD